MYVHQLRIVGTAIIPIVDVVSTLLHIGLHNYVVLFRADSMFNLFIIRYVLERMTNKLVHRITASFDL